MSNSLTTDAIFGFEDVSKEERGFRRNSSVFEDLEKVDDKIRRAALV